MLRFMVGVLALLTFMMVATAANAQDVPPGRWWHNPKIVDKLNITDAEAEQLDDTFEASRIKMVELKSQVEAEQFKLETLIKRGKANTSAIQAQHRKLEKARSALADERFGFVVKARSIIGKERFQKLVDMAPTGRKKK